MSEWISVKDRLPEKETDVFVAGLHCNSWIYSVAGLFGDEFLSMETEDEMRFTVTHWMPLPEPPKD